MSRPKKVAGFNFKRAILQASVILFTSLLGTEALLWAFAPAHDFYWQELSIEKSQTLPGLSPEIVYGREIAGFRSLNMRAKEKGDRTIRIIAIGASTTDQSTQNTSQIWASILGRHLQDHLSLFNFDIEVAAWGRPGKKVFDRAAFCTSTLIDFSPDVVITLEGVNDLAFHGGPNYTYNRSHKLTELEQNRQRKKVVHELIHVSQIARRVKLIVDERRQRRAIASGKAVEWHSEYLPALRAEYRTLPYRHTLVRDPDPIVEFKDGLGELLDCLRAINARGIVLGQPVLWKPQMSEEEHGVLWFGVATPDGPVRTSSAWLSREMARYNEVQARVAAEYGMMYVDLDSLVPKDLDIYFDDCHFTDKGSRTIASQLLPFVVEVVKQTANRRGLVAPGTIVYSPPDRPR